MQTLPTSLFHRSEITMQAIHSYARLQPVAGMHLKENPSSASHGHHLAGLRLHCSPPGVPLWLKQVRC